MVITMTNENNAWEMFQKADLQSLNDTSAMGMLQAIMAELNSVKTDTARLAQKIEGGAGAAPDMPPEGGDMGAADIPPMEGGADMGAPAPDMPPMDEGAGMGAPAQPDAAMLDMGGGAMASNPLGLGAANAGYITDETLNALQEALSRVTDPEAIAKLAEIIKEYVAGNYPAQPEGAPVGGGAPAPEEIIEALVGGDVPPEGADMGAPSPDMLLDALTRSTDAGSDNAGALPDANTTGAAPQAGGATQPIAESEDEDEKDDDDMTKTKAEEKGEVHFEGEGPVNQGEGPVFQGEGPVQVDDGDTNPAIQINLFLGAKIEDILDKNQEMGLTNKADLPTESFKVCEPEPMKKSIDDLMNEKMRIQSGINGKRYIMPMSPTEKKRNELQSIQKSIGSFDAVKGMRVGDVLTTMKGLSSRGMTSIEKSYEPIIEEMVKYCDNSINPIFTAPLFKSFGVDISKIYEPMDLEPFMRAPLSGLIPATDDWTQNLLKLIRENPNILHSIGLRGSAANKYMQSPKRFEPLDQRLSTIKEFDGLGGDDLIKAMSQKYPAVFGGTDLSGKSDDELLDLARGYEWMTSEPYMLNAISQGSNPVGDIEAILRNIREGGGYIPTRSAPSAEDAINQATGNIREGLEEGAFADVLNKAAGADIIPRRYTRWGTGKLGTAQDINADSRLDMHNAILAAIGALRDAGDAGLKFGDSTITLGDLMSDLGLSGLEDIRSKRNLADTVSAKFGANDSRNPRISLDEGKTSALASNLFKALVNELEAMGYNPEDEEALFGAADGDANPEGSDDTNAEAEAKPKPKPTPTLARFATPGSETAGDDLTPTQRTYQALKDIADALGNSTFYKDQRDLLRSIMSGVKGGDDVDEMASLDELFRKVAEHGNKERDEDSYNPFLYNEEEIEVDGDDGQKVKKKKYTPRFAALGGNNAEGGPQLPSLADFITTAMGGKALAGWRNMTNTLNSSKALKYLFPNSGKITMSDMYASMPDDIRERLVGKADLSGLYEKDKTGAPTDKLSEKNLKDYLKMKYGTDDLTKLNPEGYTSADMGSRNAMADTQRPTGTVMAIGDLEAGSADVLRQFLDNPTGFDMDVAKANAAKRRKEKKDNKNAALNGQNPYQPRHKDNETGDKPEEEKKPEANGQNGGNTQ